MNKYQELNNKQQEEFNKFPCFFAFSQEQFKEGMVSLGLNPSDTDKIYRSAGSMFYKKSDSALLKEMTDKFEKEINSAIENDKTGEGFIKDMFDYELANHEYGYTRSLDQTLEALDLTLEDIEKNKKLKHGLELALKKY